MAAPHARTTPASLPPNEGVELDPLRNPERRRRAALASTRDIAIGGDPDTPWMLAAYDAIAPHVAPVVARGPLPRLRTDEWTDAPTEVQLASLLLCGVAYVLNGDAHRLAIQLMKETSLDIHGAAPRGYWAAQANRPSREEIVRRQGDTARVAFRCDRCSDPVPLALARPPGQPVYCVQHGGAAA